MEEKDLNSIKSIQRELSELIGVSGNEEPVARFIQGQIDGLVDKMWVSPLGSLLAIIKGDKGEENIMLDAHMDEIGFMISHIDPKGFLRFVPIGGWDSRILLGQSVKILNKKGEVYHGIIGSKPRHLTTESERKAAVKISDMYIDIGLSSRDKVEECKINIGAFGTLYDPFVELPGNMVRGKAFDDRTGVNVLIQIIKEFTEKPPSDSLLFSFSVQEEVGCRGAATAAFSLDPSIALAIENTTAGDVPGIKDSECPTYIGKGPAITVADRSLLAHPFVNDRLILNAKHENIPFHIKKPLFGGTNAGRIHQAREGIPSSVVSVPCRYIHSPTSLLSIEDIFHTIKLVSAFIRNPAKVSRSS